MTNYCKAAERRLNLEEIAFANEAIAAAKPGYYNLEELFIDTWLATPRPRAYGKWFKASVLHDDLPGVRWIRPRSDRSQEYEVRPASKPAGYADVISGVEAS